MRPNVVIRIVPTAIGAHVGMDRPFTRLTFDKYEPVVCVESKALIASLGEARSPLGEAV